MTDFIYLDNAATTKPYEEVLQAMDTAMRENWGNPSSVHAIGKRAKSTLEDCRKRVAHAIGAKPKEIYFTSGATESNNLAIEGVGLLDSRLYGNGYAITSALEHPSVTKPIRALRRQGWTTKHIPAPHGEFDFNAFTCALEQQKRVDLVSIMAVQNEFGYLFPIKRIAQELRRRAPEAIFHVDAVQAVGKIPVDVNDWNVDLMTFCSHKIGGPKGIGALYVREGTELFSNALGGGQERGLRSGTQALPQIVGFTEALEISLHRRQAAFDNAKALKQQLLCGVLSLRPDTVVNSREDGSPFIVSFSIPNTNNKAIMRALSDKGICISGASACASNENTVAPGTWRPKHPLSIQLAGVPEELTESTYRISFRDTSTKDEVDALLHAFASLVDAKQ